tara:strand:+ start:197 stop:775 length:579 start_codon:yes stop_codon:yes gene_type:complete
MSNKTFPEKKRLTKHYILPGDTLADELRRRIIRVDHAGEYGAVRIYEGQLAILGNSPAKSAIQEMAEHEEKHLKVFEELLKNTRTRPTALLPIWHSAGFLLGAATALMGEKAAMACTSAIEEVIEEHYEKQSQSLGDDDAELRDTIEEFREEEAAHRDTAINLGAKEASAYKTLSTAIKKGSRLAIWLSERI